MTEWRVFLLSSNLTSEWTTETIYMYVPKHSMGLAYLPTLTRKATPMYVNMPYMECLRYHIMYHQLELRCNIGRASTAGNQSFAGRCLRDPSTSSEGTWTLQTHLSPTFGEGTWIPRDAAFRKCFFSQTSASFRFSTARCPIWSHCFAGT